MYFSKSWRGEELIEQSEGQRESGCQIKSHAREKLTGTFSQSCVQLFGRTTLVVSTSRLMDGMVGLKNHPTMSKCFT